MDPAEVFSNINHSQIYSNTSMSDEEKESQDLLLEMRNVNQPPRVVQVSPPYCSNRKRKKREDDDLTGTTYGLSDTVLHMFPFHGVDAVVRETGEPKRDDPRGFVGREGEPLPNGYCDSCRCKLNKCHDTRFGLYCGLRVAEEVKKHGAGQLFGDKIDDLLTEAYNEILRVVTVLDIERLDTHGKYKLPECMKKRSWINVMRHFYYQKFTVAMERRLTDGTKGVEGNGTFSFFQALAKDKR